MRTTHSWSPSASTLLAACPSGSGLVKPWPSATGSISRPGLKDVLRVGVFGKGAWGLPVGDSADSTVSNPFGNPATGNAGTGRREACRIARSWVPVVDHEVPVGPRDRQAIIPVHFWPRTRRRDTSTRRRGPHYGLGSPHRTGRVGHRSVRRGADGHVRAPATAGPREFDRTAASPQGQSDPRRRVVSSRTSAAQARTLSGTRGSFGWVVQRATVTMTYGSAPETRIAKLRRLLSNQERANPPRCGDGGSLIVDEKVFVHGDSHFGGAASRRLLRVQVSEPDRAENSSSPHCRSGSL